MEQQIYQNVESTFRLNKNSEWVQIDQKSNLQQCETFGTTNIQLILTKLISEKQLIFLVQI
ncbi:hypothetical protein pb186bvf_017800 [Paramecium bursaria]